MNIFLNNFEIFGLDLTLSIALTYLPAIIALFMVFKLSTKAINSLVFLSMFIGVIFNIVTPLAFIPIFSLSIATYFYINNESVVVKNISLVTLFFISTALMIHAVPGFNNPVVIQAIKISPSSTSYIKYLNLDKLLVAIFLITAVVSKPKSISNFNPGKIIIVFAVATMLALLIGIASRVIEVDVKLPLFTIGWIITMLIFTCAAEEAFFRGLIQNTILMKFTKTEGGNLLAVFVGSIIFGLAHLGAGYGFAFGASLLGFSYGYAYFKSNNIFLPILLHFCFNLTHFIFFSYPYIE